MGSPIFGISGIRKFWSAGIQKLEDSRLENGSCCCFNIFKTVGSH